MVERLAIWWRKYPDSHITSLGDSLNVRFAAIPLALLLLAGCASPKTEAEPAAGSTRTSASASPTATRSTPKPSATKDAELAFKVSRQSTCGQLFGSDKDGPLYTTIDFVNEFDDIDEATIGEAKGLKDEVDGIASHAEDPLVPLLTAFVSPMTDMIDITDSGGKAYTFDATDFKAAAHELLNLCTPWIVGGSGNTLGNGLGPQPVPTSGDYAADLAAIGIVPDNATSYGEFMKDKMCTGDPADNFSRFNMSVRTMHDGLPSDGSGAETMRLAVAYFCPERAGALEDSLAVDGYLN